MGNIRKGIDIREGERKKKKSHNLLESVHQQHSNSTLHACQKSGQPETLETECKPKPQAQASSSQQATLSLVQNMCVVSLFSACTGFMACFDWLIRKPARCLQSCVRSTACLSMSRIASSPRCIAVHHSVSCILNPFVSACTGASKGRQSMDSKTDRRIKKRVGSLFCCASWRGH